MRHPKAIKTTILGVMLAMGSVGSLHAEQHYVPGMGTYGVSTEKTTCSVCGKTFTKGEGHMCERPDRATSSGSRGSSSSAEDREAQAAIDGDPTLLSNQCSFEPFQFDDQATYDEDDNRSEASKILNDYKNGRLEKKDSHVGRNILIGVIVLGAGWWYIRRKKG